MPKIFPPGLDFVHLEQIAFPNEEVKRAVLLRGLDELGKGNIPMRALRAGETYREEIHSPAYPPVSVKFVNDAVGYGVFAEESIPAGSYIGEYTGIVKENRRVYFAPLNNYCYEYPVRDQIGKSYVIDATQGNFTRFINHSYKPNLVPEYAFFDGFYHVIFISRRPIQKGDQLCYDYGRPYWVIRSQPEPL